MQYSNQRGFTHAYERGNIHIALWRQSLTVTLVLIDKTFNTMPVTGCPFTCDSIYVCTLFNDAADLEKIQK